MKNLFVALPLHLGDSFRVLEKIQEDLQTGTECNVGPAGKISRQRK